MFYTDNQCTVLDGELHHHYMPGTHICEARCGGGGPGKGSPSSAAACSASHAVPSPCGLHCPLFCQICLFDGTFHFIRVAAVALISLDPLTRLKEVCEEEGDDIFRRTSTSLAVYSNSNAMRTHPYAHPQHMKIVKHLIYI